ncbi:GNAT family N-acetyltransferase [Neorhodopirellula lusitana]|uniref:GNAT family N-acetyltransferase n=1 Tax=Neorhodopirellula lusitana TaxID=445327 RepID=UPI0024B6D667|nr:GNAT family N-acetyltransferase [Neorhodopirellula lusitana]
MEFSTTQSWADDGLKFSELEWCSPEYQNALELRHLVLRAPLRLKLTAEELDGEHSQRHYSILDESEAVIAVVVARPKNSSLVHFRQMAVHPDHQRQGIGSKLLTQAEAELAKQGYREFQLDARAEAVGFYTRHGYEPKGEPFQLIKLEHQKMTKSV